jgi:hypothetical protein
MEILKNKGIKEQRDYYKSPNMYALYIIFEICCVLFVVGITVLFVPPYNIPP